MWLEIMEVFMTSPKRIKTKYPGVFYREVARIGTSGVERVYYILFKKEGKLYEEKVGRQYVDDMTPAKAAGIRSERIEGRRLSRKEIRQTEALAKAADLSIPTVARLWEAYCEGKKRTHAFRSTEYSFHKYLIEFACMTPDQLTTQHVAKLRDRLLGQGKSPQTVKHVLSELKRLIRFGVKNGLCAMPDAAKLHFEMPYVDNEKTETMTQEQVVAFVKALDEEPDQNAAAFMRLALVTGMRRGALMALRWDDVDFDRGFITLRGSVAKKGKTETIPMTLSARKIFEDIARTDSLYIFPGKDGGPRHDFRRMARRVKEKANLPSDFRPLHGLRHAYASFLASSGKVDLYTLQKLLTHSSPQMTQRYAHLADEAMQRAASVADEIFDMDKRSE